MKSHHSGAAELALENGDFNRENSISALAESCSVAIRLLGLLTLLVALSACSLIPSKQPSPTDSSTTPTLPDWVLNPAGAYPESSYLAAVGSALSDELAQRNARGNIAQIFSSRIRQTMLSGTSSSDDQASSFASRVALSSSDEEIVGIDIGASWFDASSGLHYSLAYLHKGEYSLYLAEQISQRQAELAALTPATKRDTAADNFNALRAYYQQLQLLPQLERWQRHQLVVSSSPSSASATPRGAIQQDFTGALRASSMCLNLKASSESDSEEYSAVEQRISRALGDIGWQIKDANVNVADCLRLVVEFELSLAQARADWHFSALELNYQILANDDSLSSGTLALESSAVKANESIRRLQTQITQELPEMMLRDALRKI